ncbi:hypothetical protein JCM5353_006645 [Sporobolomyces roseus]
MASPLQAWTVEEHQGLIDEVLLNGGPFPSAWSAAASIMRHTAQECEMEWHRMGGACGESCREYYGIIRHPLTKYPVLTEA